MPTPKPIRHEAVPTAMAKAIRYRLLNESGESESICRDVLAIEPEHHEARVTLLLAITDQFVRYNAAARLHEVLEMVRSFEQDYERAYYSGLAHERYGKAHQRTGTPGCGYRAYDSIIEAMRWFEEAERLRPNDNDDAILRWNSCVRLIERHPDLCPEPYEESIPLTLE